MIIETCPSDLVAAPAERVWSLLTNPERLAEWTGTTLVEGPRTRALVAGDRLVVATSLGLKVIFDVRALDPPYAFSVDVALPLGVINQETVHIVPLNGERSRVSFG